ncbi:histidine--tRNA ligase [Anaplasmataceae bacterium AB001_6]|nr:histidine--tRNA ligase [Anaplasmataceae bacterium AB001_6]
MKKLPSVKGMSDLYNNDQYKYDYIVDVVNNLSKTYGFQKATTPILEHTSTFDRTLGDLSDIVNKEMYTFKDKSENSLTLRPEFTAGIARFFINQLQSDPQPIKLFSHGPLFRYERPQKGRFRQFHQFNLEIIGSKSLLADVEMICLAQNISDSLKITENSVLEINSLGNTKSRTDYRQQLIDFFEANKQSLSSDSQRKIHINPLRILDSKKIEDISVVKDCPNIKDYYDPESLERFETIKDYLDKLKIKYVLNPKLVRGMDYYTHTVFEIKSKDRNNASQNTIIAGGRYDNLIKIMGGDDTPAVGFAGGIERIADLLTLPTQKEHEIAIITSSNEMQLNLVAFQIAKKLRQSGLVAIIPYAENFRKKMAKSKNVAYFIIINSEEYYRSNHITLRNVAKGMEELLYVDKNIEEKIKSLID